MFAPRSPTRPLLAQAVSGAPPDSTTTTGGFVSMENKGSLAMHWEASAVLAQNAWISWNSVYFLDFLYFTGFGGFSFS